MSTDDGKGWDVIRTPECIHVVPAQDLEEHHLSGACACQPARNIPNLPIKTHNAYDGRELIEKLEAGEKLV